MPHVSNPHIKGHLGKLRRGVLADRSTATSCCMVYMQAADFTRTFCELVKSFASEGTQHPCMRVYMHAWTGPSVPGKVHVKVCTCKYMHSMHARLSRLPAAHHTHSGPAVPNKNHGSLTSPALQAAHRPLPKHRHHSAAPRAHWHHLPHRTQVLPPPPPPPPPPHRRHSFSSLPSLVSVSLLQGLHDQQTTIIVYHVHMPTMFEAKVRLLLESTMSSASVMTFCFLLQSILGL